VSTAEDLLDILKIVSTSEYVLDILKTVSTAEVLKPCTENGRIIMNGKAGRMHCMVRPPVADGGDGLQMLRVTANTMNKQSQIADGGGGGSSVGVVRWANKPSP
jgi:hypothetical protein